MNYNEAKQNIFATGNVPNGFFGDRLNVSFAFLTGVTVVVHDSGCYRSNIPSALDSNEALYLLKNHPSARNYKNIRSIGRHLF